VSVTSRIRVTVSRLHGGKLAQSWHIPSSNLRYYQSVRVSNTCWSDLVRSLGEEEQVSRRERGANSAPKVQALVTERGRDSSPPTEPTEPNSSSPPSLLHTIRGTRHQGHATMTGTSLVNRYQHRYKTNCPRSTEIHSPINITYH
jgi:hypothetical protein